MTRKQFKETTVFTDFQKCCMQRSTLYGEEEIFAKLWEKAETEEEFLQLCRAEKALKKTQAIAELFKNDWYFLREQLGDNCEKTYSDVGSLKIGVENLSILIPNGEGDGLMRYAVIDNEDEVNECPFYYFTSIEGKNINIYDYDCGDSISQTISGRFDIYYCRKLVLIVRRKY